MKKSIKKYISIFFCVAAFVFVSCTQGVGGEQNIVAQKENIDSEKISAGTAPVTFSVGESYVDSGTSITLATQTAGATIYYTMDGSTPTASSSKYTAPLKIIGSSNDVVIVKAFARYEGAPDSPVTTVTYTIGWAENTALYLGNPSSARADVALAENYLLERSQYSLSYNSTTLIPNWVAWHLSAGDMGDVKRQDDFREDDMLPSSWYKVKKTDYQYDTYGFDRGHMCPSGDRTDIVENNSATYYMTNMVPQSPANNQTVWNDFENHIRDVVKGNPKREAYIVCGPYGKGGTSQKKENVMAIPTSSNNEITVPSHTWKAVIYLTEGTDDISRIDASTMVEAVFIPNDETCLNESWQKYRCSIDYIEEKTGYDLFSKIPDEIEAVIEAKDS